MLLPASSRASPLPQGFLSYTGFLFAEVNAGAGLPAKASGQATKSPDQKIAAFGSSYRDRVDRGLAGACELCRSCRRLRSFRTVTKKPAPTLTAANTKLAYYRDPVGARLARDGARTGNKKPADDHSSAGFFTAGASVYARRSCIRASCRSSIDG